MSGIVRQAAGVVQAPPVAAPWNALVLVKSVNLPQPSAGQPGPRPPRRSDRAAVRAELDECLRHRPDHAAARALLARLGP